MVLFKLTLPAIIAGSTDVTAQHLDPIFKPHLLPDSEPQSVRTGTGMGRQYTLRLPEGVTLSYSIHVPMLGEQEVGIGADKGLVRLSLPGNPFVLSMLGNLAAHAERGPTYNGPRAFFWFNPSKGNIVIPIPMLGEIRLEAAR